MTFNLKQTKYYTILLIWSITFVLVCVPTSGKLVDIYGVPLSISIFYFPFVYIISDLLTEVYGYSAARKVIWCSVFTQLFAIIVFQIVAFAPPSIIFQDNEAYKTVLTATPQIVFFGTIAMFLGDITNNYVLAKMKIITKGRGLSTRFVVSTLAGEIVNTAFFYTFGLWGILSKEFLFVSILVASFAKVAVEIVMLPFSIKITNWLKKEEELDYFDESTDFNPFKF